VGAAVGRRVIPTTAGGTLSVMMVGMDTLSLFKNKASTSMFASTFSANCVDVFNERTESVVTTLKETAQSWVASTLSPFFANRSGKEVSLSGSPEVVATRRRLVCVWATLKSRMVRRSVVFDPNRASTSFVLILTS
jgi:hypothetical protein